MFKNDSRINILFYSCFNERSITLESTITYFKEKGDSVFFLTTCSKGKFHESLELKGVQSFSSKQNKAKIIFENLFQIFFLIRFCRKNKIHILHSHLQLPNLYASIANYFITTKIITVRHNSDVIINYGSKKEIFVEKIINLLSPCIIAISDKVLKQLIDVEKVKKNKIIRINNGYNFDLYHSLSSEEELKKLKSEFNNKFIIISPGRLLLSKRHHLCIEAMEELIKINKNIHLIIIGDGPEKKNLENLISKLNLEKNVSLINYKENIIDYIKIADIVVQLSVSEASNNTIKEAAFYEKICIACKNVGDFSDYIIDQENGFLLQKENPINDFIKTVNLVFENQSNYSTLGKQLKNAIISQFNIDKICVDYDVLHNKILKK